MELFLEVMYGAPQPGKVLRPIAHVSNKLFNDISGYLTFSLRD